MLNKFLSHVFMALLLCSSLIAQLEEQRAYQAKDFSSILGMPGFSDDLIKMHFKLYEGYVKNINQLLSTLQIISQDKNRTQEYAGLKHMLGWEFDGMRLHEYYFENLGGKAPLNQDSPLYHEIEKQFGSFDKWREDFFATGMIRGVGWSILYLDPKENRLINCWINEHDLGHLAGGKPILVMDVWEHAFITQFGLDRAKYIKTFYDNINWNEVAKRFAEAVKVQKSTEILQNPSR